MIKFTLSFCLSFLLLASCQKENQPTTINQFTQIMCAPLTSDLGWYETDIPAPLFEGLDAIDFPVTTSNELAQKYINQGLILSFAFNHAEAARSFYYATKLDSTCAMAMWGYALVLGPNYNAGMDPGNYERAHKAIQKAKSLSSTSLKETALINALAKRYIKDPPDDRTSLDIAYANAMREVFSNYSGDANIGALTAEALMGLHPWDLWEDNGNPKVWTPEIIQNLEQVLKIDDRHPGAHHLYIHAVEASQHPEDGLASAAIFDEGLVPGAGHLLHMSSHIYIRTGDYNKGTKSNIRAVQVDSAYVSACHAQGAYPIAYYPHNYHFLSATATLSGDSFWAVRSAEKIRNQANNGLLNEPGWGTIQHYYTIPYYVYVKLGLWDKILEMPAEDDHLVYPNAVQHYARGMAYLGKEQLGKAKEELLKLKKLSEDSALEEITIWDINSAGVLVKIAVGVLDGECAASERDFEKSIKLLNEAVALEDELNYNEPPDWFFSVRHHLGAVQTEAGKYQDAVETYQEDLRVYPRNGWALHGLKNTYTMMGAHDLKREVDQQLQNIWSSADIQITSSRIK